ncbi:phosphoribosyl-AMP cyclohydrolase [Octadecabacter sp. CECT 8868]|uniref:phosphoribosyl-AMP cyclohydrolase n=1 Tax=Octadecabacter algicola TaxID=2909342 RepID=UPI001F3DE6FD|nr:phosphoribosyl-AMP cyclohydrolase [Octadecabacter algicola]MCF2905683.1 phosphoribosyl-AMP cyclohydrolase [Octadecabacter algicola]
MPMTQDDLIAARTAWGDALVAISKAFEDGGIDAARVLAGDVLDAAYGYDLGPVLFKPTLSGGAQTFRTTKEGALSYFVGHDDTYPDDAGFAIREWHDVRYEEAASFVDGDVGMWMGWAFFTDKDGNVTQADKTFGYKKDAGGNVKVVLHHSSLPYAG